MVPWNRSGEAYQIRQTLVRPMFCRQGTLEGSVQGVEQQKTSQPVVSRLIATPDAVSRKLDQPLAVIVQSSSAAGKTSLMEAILSFVPVEDQVKFSAMTRQSLYYMGEGALKHKILAIVEEEGAEQASYALKLLQSEGELMIASTGKDVSSACFAVR